MGLHDHLMPSWETVVLDLTVYPQEGTAVGTAVTNWYPPKAFKSTSIMSFTRTLTCHDIYRKEFRWSSVDGSSELLPKHNMAKSLSRRLRTELNKLVAEGKLDGKSIKPDADRQSVA